MSQISLIMALAGIALGYVLGSIPFGLIFAHLSGAGDIRKIGSGNIGATNVLRTGKKWAALATLLCDGAKGAAAVLLARHYLPPDAEILAGLGAVLGHINPLWLGFKGGKGVATFLGVTLALCWPAGLLTCAVWLGAAALWRISSLSALIAVVLAPLFLSVFTPHYLMLGILLAVIIFYMHRENIRRLVHGEEPRIGAKAKDAHGTKS
jgi:glycerol-3-phosphate acyltransferase PlsY